MAELIVGRRRRRHPAALGHAGSHRLHRRGRPSTETSRQAIVHSFLKKKKQKREPHYVDVLDLDEPLLPIAFNNAYKDSISTDLFRRNPLRVSLLFFLDADERVEMETVERSSPVAAPSSSDQDQLKNLLVQATLLLQECDANGVVLPGDCEERL